jgi:hypothetical protein
MDELSIREYITRTFAGVEVVDGSGGSFFFVGAERTLPFATLVTSDEYDQASNLNRPSVFRLNVGVGKRTFHSLFRPGSEAADEPGTGRHDFTALDRIMPHPVYGKMYWVCVLNPSAATFRTVEGLLAEAYDRAARRRTRPGQGAEA